MNFVRNTSFVVNWRREEGGKKSWGAWGWSSRKQDEERDGKSQDSNHYPNCRRFLRSGATCKLLKSILINDAKTTVSRALIGVDGYWNNHPVSLKWHILCLISVTLDNSTYYTLSHFTWRSSAGHVSQRPCWRWGRTYLKQDWHLDSTLIILSPTVWQQQEHIKRNSAFPHLPLSSIVEKVVPSVPSCHCLSLFLSQENTARHSCRFPPVDASLVNNPFSSTPLGNFLTL